MKVAKPSVIFENAEEVNEERVLRRLERYGRTCYRSEDRITPNACEFVKTIIARGHESILEHEKVTVRVVCDRGVTHEIVRHRIAAYSQESTRYCNYAGGRFGSVVTVITPFFFDPGGAEKEVSLPLGLLPCKLNEFGVWWVAMLFSEWAYMTLVNVFGRSPQEARSVLPNSLRTEIVITYNLREWRHFLRLRTSPAAHPQMREIAITLLWAFKHYLPTVFEDIPMPQDADKVPRTSWEIRVGGGEDG